MANSFQISISAKDQASAVIGGIASALNRVPSAVGRIGSAVDKLGDSSVLDKLTASASNMVRPLADAARNVGLLNGSLGLAFGATSLAGQAALASYWGRNAVAAGNAAQSIGMAAGRLRTLQNAAGLAGISADEMTGSLRGLGATLQDAAFGRNNEAAAMLNTLGIRMSRTASGAVDTERALGDLAEAIAKQTNPQTQARIAQMFGIESLLPMLRKGRAGWQDYIKEVERLAAVDEETQKQSQALGDSLNKLEAAAVGVGTVIESRLNAKFGKTVDSLTEWIAANKGTAASIAEVTGALGIMALAAKFHPVLGLVTGLVEGAILIYQHWEDIGDFFQRKFDQIDSAMRNSEWWKRTRGDVKKEDRDAYWWTFGLFGKGGFLWDTNKGGAQAATPNAAPSLSTPGAASTMPSAVPPAGERVPLGIRQNNPGNLRRWGDAPVANGFAQFATPEQGLAAAAKNLLAYQDKYGINTLAGIAGRWAPASDGNNPTAYAAGLAKHTGFGPLQPLNLRDKDTLAPLLSAIVRQENGQQPYSQQQIEQAVKVTIEMSGDPPPGTRVTAQNANGSGGPAPRVEYAMPSFASP